MRYLDLRDSIIKKTLGRYNLNNGDPYQVLPALEKDKALKALDWDKVFYSSKKEDQSKFDKSKRFLQIKFVNRGKIFIVIYFQKKDRRSFEVNYRFKKFYDQFQNNLYPGHYE